MVSPSELEAWIAALESMLHDADVARLFPLGIHLDAAIAEVYVLLGRKRGQPKSELSGGETSD